MTEATWGDTAPSNIDWRTSAALETVRRGESEFAEVTSLERAVRAWLALDEQHRRAATLRTEHGILVDGVNVTELGADGISRLAKHLPGSDRLCRDAKKDDTG